jgi:hypothetical protein
MLAMNFDFNKPKNNEEEKEEKEEKEVKEE